MFLKIKTQFNKNFEDQRQNDIKYWKGELEKKLDDVYKEIDSLEVYKKRIEKAIDAVQEPLHIAHTSLANRYY